jgi:hypothetical protein
MLCILTSPSLVAVPVVVRPRDAHLVFGTTVSSRNLAHLRCSPTSSPAMATPATLPPTSASKATKLRAYVVIKALREGNYPNNSQLLRFLETIRQHHFVTAPPTIADRVGEGDGEGPPRSISEEGKLLAGNLDAILETLESFVRDKNADELVQEFLWHTRDIDIVSRIFSRWKTGLMRDEDVD